MTEFLENQPPSVRGAVQMEMGVLSDNNRRNLANYNTWARAGNEAYARASVYCSPRANGSCSSRPGSWGLPGWWRFMCIGA
jgi:hypothetical protein